MNKGQVTNMAVLGVLVLAMGAVGITILDDMVAPYCHTATKTCEIFNGTNSSYADLLHSSIYTDTETAYNSSNCTGGALANYAMNYTDGGIILTGDDTAYISANQSITYEYYEFGTGSFNGLLATIVCYIPIMLAVGFVAVAGIIFLRK